MLRDPGGLVTKDRFHEEVWRGIPVTDEALTQCVRSLRRALGDDAANPRFIETVPKHGYRFVAPVAEPAEARPRLAPASPAQRLELLARGLSATAGGGVAGVVGGIVYGFASSGAASGGTALSGLLVLLAVNVGVGLFAGAAIGFGVALAAHFLDARSPWIAAGGLAGGLVIGALAKMLGLDAFDLLLGHTPGDITGAFEGGLMGLAVGGTYWLGRQLASWRKRLALLVLAGGATGLTIALLGGEMMGGSLALLADNFPGSHLRFDRLTDLFGEDTFGPVTKLNTSILEGAVFMLGVAGAMIVRERQASRSDLPA